MLPPVLYVWCLLVSEALTEAGIVGHAGSHS